MHHEHPEEHADAMTTNEPTFEELQGLPTDYHLAQLRKMEHEELVQQFMGLQNAYRSMLNTMALYKRQLSYMQVHTIVSGQIAELTRRLNVGDLKALAGTATKDVAAIFEAKYAALWLVDAEANLLALKQSWPESQKYPALDLTHDEDVMIVHALKTRREPVAIESVAQYERMAEREMREIDCTAPLREGALLCPLVLKVADVDQPLVGILLLAGKSEGFTPQDAENATIIAEMVAASINTCALLEKMSELAETDGLTQLYNHRHFQQALDRALATARRYETAVSLMMIDIDHFKKFNDTHGHQAGDMVLREVSRMVRQSVRDNIDIAARYGGEEFAVILPHTEIKGALIAAERLRATVERHAIRLGGQHVTVTVSVGVAEYVGQQKKALFIESADAALYAAKNGGRNRVEYAPGGAPEA